jgi:hypothetical protein
VKLRAILLTLFAAFLWAAWDLYWPVSNSLRDFDASELGRMETRMWRSYYAHERIALFGQLAATLRRQYHLPLLRSYVVGYHAARAAVMFQRGRSRGDYEEALPQIRSFYTAIRRNSSERFDVDRAARLELDWWIVHRERGSHPRMDLVRTLAELQATLYRIPPDRLIEHASLRAEAMLLRDSGPDAAGWVEIERLLCASWNSLHRNVNDGSQTTAELDRVPAAAVYTRCTGPVPQLYVPPRPVVRLLVATD